MVTVLEKCTLDDQQIVMCFVCVCVLVWEFMRV